MKAEVVRLFNSSSLTVSLWLTVSTRLALEQAQNKPQSLSADRSEPGVLFALNSFSLFPLSLIVNTHGHS